MSKELASVKKTVIKTFADFGIEMEVLRAYEGINHIHLHLVPKKPVRMHEITGYLDDLRFALGRYVIKIEAPVQNKREIKVSVLKESRGETVQWSQLYDHLKSQGDTAPLTVPLGIAETNETMLIDFASVSHLLIGGRVISGKSNLIHGIINSLILRHGPSALRLILIDPKQDSLFRYKKLPHLLTEPIASPEKTVMALKWVYKEMERRFDILEATNHENIESYHASVRGQERRDEPLPYIFVVIDELADVMSEYGDDAEKILRRIAIMAHGVGIHLILATASAEPRILRGMLRANIFNALSFVTESKQASEAVLYQPGAEDLIGRGTALFTTPDIWPAIEVQTGLLTDKETKDIVLKVKRRHGVVDENNIDLQTLAAYNLTIFAFDEEDDLYEEAKKAIVEAGKASTSYLQRKLRIGYSRAARLMDLLEERGVIGPADGSNPREVLE